MINKSYDGYCYKPAQTINPRNPANLADPFEVSIIDMFDQDPELREWSGTRARGSDEYFTLARRAKPYEGPCMLCHGRPDDAPSEGTARGSWLILVGYVQWNSTLGRFAEVGTEANGIGVVCIAINGD